MAIQNYLAETRVLIARNELSAAFEMLRVLLENSPRLDEVIQLSGRFAAIQKQIRLDVVSRSEANLTENKIQQGLVDATALLLLAVQFGF